MVTLCLELFLQLQYIFFGVYLELKRVYGISFVLPALKIAPVDIAEREYILLHLLPLASPHRAHIVAIVLIVVVHVAVVESHVQRVAGIVGIRSRRPIVAADNILSIQFMALHRRASPAAEALCLKDTAACILMPPPFLQFRL